MIRSAGDTATCAYAPKGAAGVLMGEVIRFPLEWTSPRVDRGEPAEVVSLEGLRLLDEPLVTAEDLEEDRRLRDEARRTSSALEDPAARPAITYEEIQARLREGRPFRTPGGLEVIPRRGPWWLEWRPPDPRAPCGHRSHSGPCVLEPGHPGGHIGPPQVTPADLELVKVRTWARTRKGGRRLRSLIDRLEGPAGEEATAHHEEDPPDAS